MHTMGRRAVFSGLRQQLSVTAVLVLAACGSAPPSATPVSPSPPSPLATSASPARIATPTPSPSATTFEPGPRRDAAFAWDPKDGYLLMFGGIAGGGSDATVFGDTWARTGTQWLELHPPLSPPARSGASLGYDPVGNRMLLYGGGTNFYLQGVDPSRNDTWAWDGETWTQLHAHSPTPGACCSPTEMVYDPSTPVLWLTMGLLQMWSWTGSDWILAESTARPPERFEFGLAYDGQLRGVVAVCGYAGEGNAGLGEAAPYHDDTWLWRDAAWTELHPRTAAARGPCAAAFDIARNEMVLFSGLGGTLTFDGSNWTLRHPAHEPPIEPDLSASFAYDPVAHQVVLFGGTDNLGRDLDQTWTWDGVDWSNKI
jgi:hypothetical protein